MTGIRERRFWNAGSKPSEGALLAARKLLERSGLEAGRIGALIFCAVSRDFVEPATSTVLHRQLGLSHDCLNYDISNACLGLVSGILSLANMIELGQIEAGIALCGENAGPLLENTIASLNADMSLTRSSVKAHFASLTIGSGQPRFCCGARVLASRTACCWLPPPIRTVAATICVKARLKAA